MNAVPRNAAAPTTDLLDALESGALPPAEFNHAAHVRAAWICLEREPSLGRALHRFSLALARYAARLGASNKYHETLTVAFVLLIHDRRQRSAPGTWEDFAAANPDLLAWPNPVIARWYEPGVLWSDLARRAFLLPAMLSAEPARHDEGGGAPRPAVAVR